VDAPDRGGRENSTIRVVHIGRERRLRRGPAGAVRVRDHTVVMARLDARNRSPRPRSSSLRDTTARSRVGTSTRGGPRGPSDDVTWPGRTAALRVRPGQATGSGRATSEADGRASVERRTRSVDVGGGRVTRSLVHVGRARPVTALDAQAGGAPVIPGRFLARDVWGAGPNDGTIEYVHHVRGGPDGPASTGASGSPTGDVASAPGTLQPVRANDWSYCSSFVMDIGRLGRQSSRALPTRPAPPPVGGPGSG
jgi:hypothetical protein